VVSGGGAAARVHGSSQTIVMSRQPAQDQVKAAIARLEVELASDGVVLRSQPPVLPPGDDAPLLGLGSSRVDNADTVPPVPGSTRRKGASCEPHGPAPLSRGGSDRGSRSLAPSEHELSRRLAEQSQRRAEGAASGRFPTAGSSNEEIFGGGRGGGASGGGGGGGGGGSGGGSGSGGGGGGCVDQRARLLKAPGVGAALDRLWAAIPPCHDSQGTGDNQPPRAAIGRDEYLAMHHKMVLRGPHPKRNPKRKPDSNRIPNPDPSPHPGPNPN
jgi:hypothetical protein